MSGLLGLSADCLDYYRPLYEFLPGAGEYKEYLMENQHETIETGESLSAPTYTATREIRQMIQSGRLEENERLPSVRELVRQLNVTRYAVCQAISHLEMDGYLYKQHHRYFVRKTPKQHQALSIADSIVILADPGQINGSNLLIPGFDRIIEVGAMIAARQAHMNVLTVDPDPLNDNFEEELINVLAERPRGVIAFHGTLIHEPNHQILDVFKSKGVAIAIYGNGPDYTNYDTVESDHEFGAYELTKLLISKGRRRILPFMPLQVDMDTRPLWLKARLKGHRKALDEAGIEPMPELNCPATPHEMETKEEYYTAVRIVAGHLLEYLKGDNPVDAIMAISDKFIFPLTAACRDLFDLDVTRDILITGYDNYWSDSHLKRWDPARPFATVDKHNFELGGELIKLISGRINSEITGKPVHRLVKPELIVTE